VISDPSHNHAWQWRHLVHENIATEDDLFSRQMHHHVGEKLDEERIMLALDLSVGLRLFTPPVRTDDGGLRKKMIGVDMIKVGMGIDQEADRLVRNSTDFRQHALGHCGIGQT